MSKVLVVANQKGGVGKTTTVVQAAFQFAQQGLQVLVVDLDGQANASTALADVETVSQTAAALFGDEVVEISVPKSGFGLIPASFSLNEVEEMDIHCIANPRRHLERATWPDLILIDTPPSLGRRLLGALCAADYVVTPMELSRFSIDGLEQLMTSIDMIRDRFNPGLEFIGVLPTKVNTRSSNQKATLASLYRELGENVIPQMVAFRAPVADAIDAGQPVAALGTGAARKAAMEYRQAVEHIGSRMGLLQPDPLQVVP